MLLDDEQHQAVWSAFGHITESYRLYDKGSEIANQLLGFAKVDAYYTSSIDVNRLVRRTMENLDLKGKEIVLDVDLDSKSLVINADPDKINLAIGVIVDNAILAMPEGGRFLWSPNLPPFWMARPTPMGLIRVFCQDNPDRHRCGHELRDPGKIFKPFYSADHRDYPEKKGWALPLHGKLSGIIMGW